MASLAVRELRQMILDGEIKPGERLNEVLIAESLGISRGPLREHGIAGAGSFGAEHADVDITSARLSGKRP